jgi:hypothetical protein
MVGRVNPRLAGCLSLGWYYRIKKKREKINSYKCHNTKYRSLHRTVLPSPYAKALAKALTKARGKGREPSKGCRSNKEEEETYNYKQ